MALLSTDPRRRLALCALATGCFAPRLAAQAPQRAPGEVLIGGTGAGLGPLQQVLLEQPGVVFVPSLGTSGGLKALAAGAIDVALAARRLSDDEKARGLAERELFRTPVVWAVHARVPLRETTLDELAALYAGRTARWADGSPVRLVLRPETDSDTRYVRSLTPALAEAVGQAQARPGVHVATTDLDAIESIERIAGALGVTTLGLALAEQRRLRVLTLDGVVPSLEAMASRRYPHQKTVWLMTRGAPQGAVADTVRALTRPAAGRNLAAIGCQLAG